jgi:hypothetical protein
MMMHDLAARPRPEGIIGYGPPSSVARTIVRRFDPVAWAYVRLGIVGEDERALQARHLADVLTAQGAPAAAMHELRDRLLHAPVAPRTLAMFASSDGVMLHEELLPDTVLDDRVGFTAPAEVLAVLAHDQERPPFVHVVIDRSGADLTYSAGAGAALRHAVVVGTDDEIERNAPGGRSGLSQSRYQRRAEDSWKHNAAQVADAVIACAAKVGAQALVLSGDVRAVQLLEHRLPEEPALFVRHISGSRSADGSQAARGARLSDALHDVAQAQTQHLIQVFEAYLDPAGHAVQGVEATVHALAADRVATLLIAADVPDREVWFGADGTAVWPHEGSAALADGPVRAGRLVDVAVRSALLTGARVRVIPPDTPGTPADGIGALCRYAE